MSNCASNGMKIGMKMTMISVHSIGQPSRKITTCARIMNCSGVRSSDSTHVSISCCPPSNAKAAAKIAEPTKSQQTTAASYRYPRDPDEDDAEHFHGLRGTDQAEPTIHRLFLRAEQRNEAVVRDPDGRAIVRRRNAAGDDL